MFAAQQRFYEETYEINRERFFQITASTDVVNTFNLCLKHYADFLHMGDKKPYDAAKRKLPLAMYMCTFETNSGSKGEKPLGKWRNQAAVKLNGLVMIDFDGLENPMEEYKKIPDHFFEDDCKQQILLGHITPSGHGLRLVFKADLNVGNIADNQQWMAAKLGMKADDSCKDASRGSFFPSKDAILYIDDQLFTYNDEKFDKEFGDYYRSGKSAATGGNRKVTSKGAGRRISADRGKLLAPAGEVKVGSEQAANVKETDIGKYQNLINDGYNGISYPNLIERWLEQNGTPQSGSRHLSFLRMAGDFRYITDYRILGHVLRMAPYVAEWETDESVTLEIDNIVRDVTSRQQYWKMPKRMSAVLESFTKQEKKAEGAEMSWYETFALRLKPLMAPPYDVACQMTTEQNWFGAIIASGAMFGTLMTRCWYEHYDGNPTRINPQVYIIGRPASGKSFVDRLDKEIMACMRAADEVGREAERRYKEEQRERASSKKAANGDVLKRPEPIIRYLPSRTSNAVFYRRSVNAKEMIDGELTKLHLYTFDSELDSTMTAQSGGSWIGKHDLELKAFANESSGVDYANSESENAVIPIYWNTVTTGTPVSLAKKVKPSNILDGLCSRLAIFKMYSEKYKMIARGSSKRNHDLELALKEWGYFFDRQKGELKVKPLVDKVYDLCEMSAFESDVASDDVLDFLRRRAVYYAEWFTLPRIVARLRDNKDGKIEVTEDDLQFAELIYDGILYWQDNFFGTMISDALNLSDETMKQRAKKTVRGSEYLEKLPEEFKTSDAAKIFGVKLNVAVYRLKSMVKIGLIHSIGYGKWKKGGGL